jgi:hypothetical protein
MDRAAEFSGDSAEETLILDCPVRYCVLGFLAGPPFYRAAGFPISKRKFGLIAGHCRDLAGSVVM